MSDHQAFLRQVRRQDADWDIAIAAMSSRVEEYFIEKAQKDGG